MEAIEAVTTAYWQLVNPKGDGYVNIGKVVDLAASLMGKNRQRNLSIIQTSLESNLLQFHYATHLIHNLNCRKRWPNGDYLQHGLRICGRNMKVMCAAGFHLKRL